ncbi:hypothetical protein PMIN06_002777 [Paraphaeosphaeria minitans]
MQGAPLSSQPGKKTHQASVERRGNLCRHTRRQVTGRTTRHVASPEGGERRGFVGFVLLWVGDKADTSHSHYLHVTRPGGSVVYARQLPRQADVVSSLVKLC